MCTKLPYNTSPAEKDLVHRIHFKLKKKPTEIASATGSELSSIVRCLDRKGPPMKPGPKPALDEAKVERLETLLEDMIQKANTEYEVTAEMLKTRSKLKESARTIMDSLHQRGVYCRLFRHKLQLTDED